LTRERLPAGRGAPGGAGARAGRGGAKGARVLFAAALVASSAAGAACVDLFHSTDFETLCSKDPPDPSCSDGASPDGSAGSDAAADAGGHPDFCAWTGDEAQQHAARACAWLGACEGPIDSTRFGPCVAAARLAYDCTANRARRPLGEVDALWGCLATVDSCAAVDACVFPGGVPVCDAVSSGSFTTCAGDVRVECSRSTQGRPTAVEPCAASSRVCTKRNDGFAQCTGEERDHCSGLDRCVGTALVTCGTGGDSAIDLGYDCAGYGGGACRAVGASNTPVCVPGDAEGSCGAQSTAGVVQCDDDLARTCVGEQDESVGCGALGSKCVVDAGTPAFPERACAQPVTGLACSGDDRCTGDKLTSCAGPVTHVLSCASVGLGSCVALANGYARCTPPP
jgi:hypothetical protein